MGELAALTLVEAGVNVSGSLLTEAGVWFVAAFDASGVPSGVSDMRPIAP